MQFNSFTFLFFVIIVFFLYWNLKKDSIKIQNLILLIASYVFYAWWDWRFLGLILFSSLIDYYAANKIYLSESKSSRKAFLFLSLAANLGLLGFFKYFNFFIDSLNFLLNSLHLKANLGSLEIILPIGISFYTFQTMSYSLDVYQGKLKPCDDLLAYLSYVSFFPQLVAGPIERASNLLTQFLTRRDFNYDAGMAGIKMIVWGLFKKTVIADNAAVQVNYIFNHFSELNSLYLLSGCIFFSIQIYCDFSGYSDIAIGLGKLFGFDLMRNFNYPYFSKSIAEFWRKWHISLTSWLKDYLFKPLGGSRGSKLLTLRNVLIVFLLSGLWHGANWTFIFWGLVNAVLYIPHVFLSEKNNKTGVLTDFFKRLSVFILISLTWILFRSKNIFFAKGYFLRMINPENFSLEADRLGFLVVVFLFFIFEWFFRNDFFPLENVKNKAILYFYHLILVILILNYGFIPQEFIYFQF